MTTRINEREAEVSVDAQTWQFALDVGGGTACIELDGSRFTVHAQSWQQKRMLARFAHLGESFLEDQFLRSCLGAESPPRSGAAREALIALARWLNAPGGNAGLPLDPQLLAQVTLQVCRAIQAVPQTLAGLDAADVEMLWQAARVDAPVAEQGGTPANRIVVVPDTGVRAEKRAAPTLVKPEVRQPEALDVVRKTQSGSTNPAHEVDVHEEAASAPELRVDAPPARPQHQHGIPRRCDTSRFRVRLGSHVERSVRSSDMRAHVAEVSGTTDAGRQPIVIPGSPPEHALVPLASPMMGSPWSTVGDESQVAKSEPARWSLSAPAGTWWPQSAMGPAVIHPAASATAAVDNEQLFEELATRLEQAAAEQGIDSEP